MQEEWQETLDEKFFVGGALTIIAYWKTFQLRFTLLHVFLV